MYKVLVTTVTERAGVDSFVCVHTTVVEFGNAKDAQNAANRVNEQRGNDVYGYRQRALLLF